MMHHLICSENVLYYSVVLAPQGRCFGQVLGGDLTAAERAAKIRIN